MPLTKYSLKYQRSNTTGDMLAAMHNVLMRKRICGIALCCLFPNAVAQAGPLDVSSAYLAGRRFTCKGT